MKDDQNASRLAKSMQRMMEGGGRNRKRLFKRILLVWSWMGTGALLCGLGFLMYVGLGLIFLSLFYYRSCIEMWRNHGYSLILLNGTTAVLMLILFTTAFNLYHG